jgi:hypothetical protein
MGYDVGYSSVHRFAKRLADSMDEFDQIDIEGY